MPTEFVAPILSVCGTILVALIVGAFAAYNRRRGNQESKMPTVQQIWDEQRKQAGELAAVRGEVSAANTKADAAKREATTYKTAFIGLRDVFLSFVERAQNGGPFELTMDEHRALELPVTNVEEDDLAGS